MVLPCVFKICSSLRIVFTPVVKYLFTFTQKTFRVLGFGQCPNNMLAPRCGHFAIRSLSDAELERNRYANNVDRYFRQKHNEVVRGKTFTFSDNLNKIKHRKLFTRFRRPINWRSNLIEKQCKMNRLLNNWVRYFRLYLQRSSQSLEGTPLLH